MFAAEIDWPRWRIAVRRALATMSRRAFTSVEQIDNRLRRKFLEFTSSLYPSNPWRCNVFGCQDARMNLEASFPQEIPWPNIQQPGSNHPAPHCEMYSKRGLIRKTLPDAP